MAPQFLERKLKKEYPGNDHAVYGTLNKIGAMHGNKETPKGKRMENAFETKYRAKLAATKAKHQALKNKMK